MANDSRNNFEKPCYMDAGAKLFPEAPEGQGLDLTDPTNRDQMLKKHIIRETEQKGMKPVRVWLYVHEDAISGKSGIPATGTSLNEDGQYEDFYGDGGQRVPQGNLAHHTDPGDVSAGTASNFYHENKERVYAGPETILAEYQPVAAANVLLDMGIDRPINDIFFFLRDDQIKLFGRELMEGDLIERFDGLIMEVVTSQPHQAENWEWLYTQVGAQNTNKDHRALFRD